MAANVCERLVAVYEKLRSETYLYLEHHNPTLKFIAIHTEPTNCKENCRGNLSSRQFPSVAILLHKFVSAAP